MKPLVLFAVAGAALAFGQDLLPLPCGTPLNGTLSKDTPTRYVLSSVGNETVVIRVLSPTALTLQMTNPSGQTVNPARSLGASAAASAAEFRLVRPGDYQVSLQAKETGTFQLVMMRVNQPCQSRTVTCGSYTRDSITSANQLHAYLFDATQADVVSLRLFKTAGDPQAAFGMIVYDPDGSILKWNGRDAAAADQATVRMDLPITKTGTHVAIAGDFSNGVRTGSYTITQNRLNAPCNGSSTGCGTALDATIPEIGASNVYQVDAAQGDVFLAGVVLSGTAPGFQPAIEVYSPQGKALTSSAAKNAVFSAVTTGTYSVFVRDLTYRQTGPYSFTLRRLNRPCSAQALNCASVTDASINGPLRYNTYSINAEAGDVYLLRLVRTNAGTGFKPLIEVYDSGGNRVQNTTTTDLSRVFFSPQAPGIYSVIASDGWDSTRTGGYSFSLTRVNRPCNASSLDCGVPASGRLEGPLRFAQYTYSGDPFSLRILDVTNASRLSVEIYDSLGRPVGTPLSGNIRGIDVAAAGSFTFLALDENPNPSPSAFLLDLLRTRNACGTTPSAGQTVTGAVSGPTPFTAYTVQAHAGDALLFRTAGSPRGFAPNMDLYGPDGVRTASAPFAVTRTAAVTGPHTVIVGPSSPGTMGGYVFSWQTLNNPANVGPAVCGQPLAGSLTPTGQFRYFSIPASAGDQIKLLLSKVADDFTPQLELFDPAGNRLAGASEINRRVSADGNYLALVSPGTSDSTTGSFWLGFQRPNRPCNAANLACGQPVLRSVDSPAQLDAFSFAGNAGEKVVLQVPNRLGTFLPFLELYDPSGAVVQSGVTTSITRTLTASGAYTLLVRDRVSVNTGTYRATLQHDPEPCPVTDTEKPTLKLARPAGGEVIAGGLAFRIIWQSDDNVDVASHTIQLSRDGGATFTPIAAGLSGAAQAYDWTPPADLAPTRNARLQVTAVDRAGNQQSAVSDALTLIGSGFTENTGATFDYDALNRIVRAAYKDGTVVTYAYDAAGNLTQVSVSGP